MGSPQQGLWILFHVSEVVRPAAPVERRQILWELLVQAAAGRGCGGPGREYHQRDQDETFQRYQDDLRYHADQMYHEAQRYHADQRYPGDQRYSNKQRCDPRHHDETHQRDHDAQRCHDESNHYDVEHNDTCQRDPKDQRYPDDHRYNPRHHEKTYQGNLEHHRHCEPNHRDVYHEDLHHHDDFQNPTHHADPMRDGHTHCDRMFPVAVIQHDNDAYPDNKYHMNNDVTYRAHVYHDDVDQHHNENTCCDHGDNDCNVCHDDSRHGDKNHAHVGQNCSENKSAKKKRKKKPRTKKKKLNQNTNNNNNNGDNDQQSDLGANSRTPEQGMVDPEATAINWKLDLNVQDKAAGDCQGWVEHFSSKVASNSNSNTSNNGSKNPLDEEESLDTDTEMEPVETQAKGSETVKPKGKKQWRTYRDKVSTSFPPALSLQAGDGALALQAGQRALDPAAPGDDSAGEEDSFPAASSAGDVDPTVLDLTDLCLNLNLGDSGLGTGQPARAQQQQELNTNASWQELEDRGLVHSKRRGEGSPAKAKDKRRRNTAEKRREKN